ncbi:DUF4485 domain-containing protein [Aphis craccivora]|uniref:DUF4485 domain-containing protein n=1 Tax=Aphis craccivora TaxID=307492 RepID=A0A6G0ZR10_APHCR|nr:DUF4485 domain-containing protein [Aphis craccivora]
MTGKVQQQQNIEEKTIEDFLFFLVHFKEAFDSLKSESDKEICKKWLDKLAVETYKSTNEKQARNIYLSQLILSMNDRKLTAPFNESPKPGPLSLDGVFTKITSKPSLEIEQEKEINDNKENWTKFIRNRELEMVDLNHLSNDGRTYIACKTLPENGGLFAYVAVTVGGNTGCWVNCCGRPIPPPVVKPIDLKVEMSSAPKKICEQEDKVYQLTAEVRAILSNRRSQESRMLTYEFFKRLLNNIEQEMLSEEDPNSTACHDPHVEALLEKLIVESKGCENFNPRLFKRIKMLSLLKKRLKNMLQEIEDRNQKLSNHVIASTSPILSLLSPASTCSNSMTEMMWQGALMEKPTSKMADTLAKTYPVCVVKMLLALLARERRKIINQLQVKQENLVASVKRDLFNEIKKGIMAYKVARQEWVDVMRVVMHYNKIKESLAEKDLGGSSNNTKSDYLQETIHKEIEDTMKRLDKGNRKNEKLQDDICELNKSIHVITEKIELEQVQAEDQLRAFQNEICTEKSLIMNRTQTISKLEKMVKATQK